MKEYEIKHMIIDDEDGLEEHVTADFSYQNNDYSITFNKSDFEIINIWLLEGETSLPANVSDDLIESIREDVKRKI
jgi:hypothetical protein